MSFDRQRQARTSPLREPPKPSLFVHIGRFAGQALVILVITVAVGEAAARWILDIRPLTPGDLVWDHHPWRGWAHRPGAEDTFVKLAARQRIQINSQGLREREIPHGREPGVARVLVLGDSNVAGFEVGLADVWTRVAEASLRDQGVAVEFINAGTRGYGTDQSLLFLMDEGIKYSPDLVLYFWNDNDLGDNVTVHRPFRLYGKGYYDLDDNGSLVLRGVPVPRFPYDQSLLVGEDGEVVELTVPPTVGFRMWVRDNVVATSSFGAALVHVAAAVPGLSGAIESAGSFSQDEGVATRNRVERVTAAMIREMHAVSCAADAGFRFIVDGDQSIQLGREAGVAILDPWEAFYAGLPEDAAVIVPFDTHFNELGHEAFGQAVAGTLARGDWLTPTDCPTPGH